MEDKIWTCFVRRFSHTETEDSKNFLDQWLNEDELHLQKYMEAKSLWELTAMVAPEPGDTNVRKLTAVIQEPEKERPKLSVLWRYGWAAALTGIFLFLALYYSSRPQKPEEQWVTYEAKLGEIITVQLPDQSTVWLNAGSQIRYLKGLKSAKLRELYLQGEAYFEVKHDQQHPFVVHSNHLETTVYGTSFSVRAYADEPRNSVSVNSGKVGVQALDKPQAAIMLLPNDKLGYLNGRFEKYRISNKDVDSWTKGEIIFEQTPMPEVIHTLARKYKVKIDPGSSDYSNCKLTARFQRQPLSTILKTLNISMNISSKQIADTIYLKGGNCM